MKNLKNLGFLFIFSLLFISVSCGSDDDNNDDDNGTTNEFVYDGTAYALTNGFIQEYGGASLFNFDITLYGGLVLQNEQFSGTGEVVYFEMWTDQATSLKSGTYNYAATESDLTFTIGEIGIDCDTTTQSCATNLVVASGTVDLDVSGSNYDVDFNLTTTTGENVTGTFSGTLPTL